MSVNNLTGTVWLFNSTLGNKFPSGHTVNQLDDTYESYSINAYSNNLNINGISFEDSDVEGRCVMIYGLSHGLDSINAYNYASSGSWTSTAYKTISITGGTDATNATLIAWFEANATQQDLTAVDITSITGYSGLENGNHTLGIKATDSTGTKEDSSMASVTFRKLPTPVYESITDTTYSFDVYRSISITEYVDIFANDIYLGSVSLFYLTDISSGGLDYYCFASSGMTWGSYVNSDYNPTYTGTNYKMFKFENNTLKYFDGTSSRPSYTEVGGDGESVSSSSPIVRGHEYYVDLM